MWSAWVTHNESTKEWDTNEPIGKDKLTDEHWKAFVNFLNERDIEFICEGTYLDSDEKPFKTTFDNPESKWHMSSPMMEDLAKRQANAGPRIDCPVHGKQLEWVAKPYQDPIPNNCRECCLEKSRNKQ